MNNDLIWMLTISLTVFIAVALFVGRGWNVFLQMLRRTEQRYERVLVQQLLLDVQPRAAMAMAGFGVLVCALIAFIIVPSQIALVIGAAIGFTLPSLIIRHLEQKRMERLNVQLVDAITTLASGLRAGLNMVQTMQLLVANTIGPVRQEFAQILREYDMGLDLNQAMHNASERIGLTNYRLLFTAIQMHRQRGGNAAESLDRIAASIREIQRLEGKLDALTAQGRWQARMIAIAPVFLLGMFWMMDPKGVELMFSSTAGRMLVLIAVLLIAGGFLWIRRILQVDI